MFSLLLGTKVISKDSLYHFLFKVVPVASETGNGLAPSFFLLVNLTYKTSEDPACQTSVWEREVLSYLSASPLAALHLVFMETCFYSVGFWWVCFQLGSEEE